MLLAAGRRGRAGSRGYNPRFDIDSPQAECPLSACKMGMIIFTWLLEEVEGCISHLRQKALFLPGGTASAMVRGRGAL